MALIKCADCGKDVSEHAKECPNCGCPVAFSLSAQTQTPPQRQAAPASPASKPAVQYTAPAPPVKKRSGAGKIVIAVVLVLLAVFVLPNLFPEAQEPAQTTPPNQNTIPTIPKQETGDSLHYITSRSVDYDSANQYYRVFFGFTNADGVYQIAKSGTASITIRNNAGEIVYDKKVPFDSSDFGSWSNPTWDSSRTLVCIYIKPSEISSGASSNGTLTLQVTADTSKFPANTMNLTDLPLRDLNLHLPSLPRTFKDYDYRGDLDATVRVEKITYDCTVYEYNNVQIILHVQSTMLYNSTPGISKYVYVGYKLRNSDGIIVDSGTINIKQSDSGDTSLTDLYIFNLNMLETYTLELDNSID